MSYSYDSLSNTEQNALVPDERDNIEDLFAAASHKKSPIRAGHQMRLIKEAMPNSSLMACREPLANESIVAALEAFDPQDEQECLLAHKMIIVHEHAMDCFQRAKKEGLPAHTRDQELKHAEKLMAIAIKLSEALDKHRGKGNQQITVKRFDVSDGGQAILGNVNTGAAAGAREAHHPGNARGALGEGSAASDDSERLVEQLNIRQRKRAKR